MRNNRIRTNKHLNQYCKLTSDLELMLLGRTPKIVLQQYLPEPVILSAVRTAAAAIGLRSAAF
jgi:hypothetical protein